MVLFPSHQAAAISCHVGPVHCVAYSAGSGQYVLSGGQDRKVHLFNPSTATLIQTYDAHGYEVLSLAVSPDNARFASVGGDKAAFLWDVATAKTVRRFAGHYARINTCGFNHDASVLVTGSFDATVRLWDTKSNSTKPLMLWDEGKDSISSLVVGDGEVITGCVDGRLRRYDLRMGTVYVDLIAHPITSVTQTQDENAVLVSSLDGTIRLMDKAGGGCLQSYRGHTNGEYRVQSTFAMVDSYVVSGSEDGWIYAWDVLEGKCVVKERAHGGKVVSAVAVNDARREMVTAGVDGTVVVWRTE
ncbi:hypothetical protein DRE_06280 [Drechslerella stenobrocha 248]|uniref:Uncharacterized protein n=1 Tax=Drechslerella stenobrocha 248 TaxID=1043628 RepID=W7I7R8_9PEZI|nr:hypothetical protein DRE_06280 [Drechslerella stenobrocha 248]